MKNIFKKKLKQNVIFGLVPDIQKMDPRNKCEDDNQTGRSMVEMLGVLAVIGVISVGGISAYTTAMNKHRANELLNEANKRAVVLAMKIVSGEEITNGDPLSEFGTNTVSGATFGTVGTQTNTFTIALSGASEFCDQLKTLENDSIMVFNEDCTQITFNKDLSKNPTSYSGGSNEPVSYTYDPDKQKCFDSKGNECTGCEILQEYSTNNIKCYSSCLLKDNGICYDNNKNDYCQNIIAYDVTTYDEWDEDKQECVMCSYMIFDNNTNKKVCFHENNSEEMDQYCWITQCTSWNGSTCAELEIDDNGCAVNADACHCSYNPACHVVGNNCTV